MKTTKKNPYATNKGGLIKAINPVKDDPKSTKNAGTDLRAGK